MKVEAVWVRAFLAILVVCFAVDSSFGAPILSTEAVLRVPTVSIPHTTQANKRSSSSRESSQNIVHTGQKRISASPVGSQTLHTLSNTSHTDTLTPATKPERKLTLTEAFKRRVSRISKKISSLLRAKTASSKKNHIQNNATSHLSPSGQKEVDKTIPPAHSVNRTAPATTVTRGGNSVKQDAGPQAQISGLTSGLKAAYMMERFSSAVEQIEAHLLSKVENITKLVRRKRDAQPKPSIDSSLRSPSNISRAFNDDHHEFLEKRTACRGKFAGYNINSELCACELMHTVHNDFDQVACLRRVSDRALRIAKRTNMQKTAFILYNEKARCRARGETPRESKRERECLELMLRKRVGSPPLGDGPRILRKLLSETDFEEDSASAQRPDLPFTGRWSKMERTLLANLARATAFVAYTLALLIVLVGLADITRHYRRRSRSTRRNTRLNQALRSMQGLYCRCFSRG